MSNYKLKSFVEMQLQSDCVRWFDKNYSIYKDFLISLPNGFNVHFGDIINENLSDLGFKKDTPDLFLAINNHIYSGLFIELVPISERLRKKKYEYLCKLESNGYMVAIINNLDDFKHVIKDYLACL